MARGLSEDALYAALLLALLPGAFPGKAAAQLLHLPLARTRSRLHALTRVGLLSTHGACEQQRWEMHACVRGACCDLSEALNLSHAASR